MALSPSMPGSAVMQPSFTRRPRSLAQQAQQGKGAYTCEPCWYACTACTRCDEMTVQTAAAGAGSVSVRGCTAAGGEQRGIYKGLCNTTACHSRRKGCERHKIISQSIVEWARSRQPTTRAKSRVYTCTRHAWLHSNKPAGEGIAHTPPSAAAERTKDRTHTHRQRRNSPQAAAHHPSTLHPDRNAQCKLKSPVASPQAATRPMPLPPPLPVRLC